ncbi:MAG: hypothetical protein ABI759_05720 [Candidatus Solibacter sp.]
MITLDGAGSGRPFEGEGAMSSGGSSRLLIDYPEPYRGQILDYLFKPNYGASLQDLKIEIGGDVNSTDGSEPSHMHSPSDQNYYRGFEWWLMEQAKLRNPNISLGILAWGAPGWIGNGHFFSQDAINYIINFIKGAKTYHNLTIDYVGILDERPYDPYWIINLKAALRTQGLTTKIVAADESSAQIVQDMLAIPALMDAVDVLGFHYPRFDGGFIGVNKPIWASEEGQAWYWNGNWPGGAYLAKAYNRGYISSRITRHQVWSLITSYYDILMFPGSGQMYANTPWSGNYSVQPAIWATAHTNQFAGPGWQYIDNSCGLLGYASYVTLKKGSDFSVIIENVDGVDASVTFNIVNGLSTGPVHVWKSDPTAQFVQQADIVPVNGSFSFTLAAGAIYSLTTTTGQAKGNASPPPPAPFPFPYSDTFESYSLSGQAKYLFDLNGSFEIANCAGGRTGLCLRQAAPAPPIPWTTIGPIEPSSLMGSTSWDNYQISADVFFEQPGSVKLMGRVARINVDNGDTYGYELYVDQPGNWSLRQGNFVTLAYGAVPFGAGTWHNVKMILDGATIRIAIDGITVGSRATDGTYGRGMAGLGVRSWTTAQFDNFRIDPIGGPANPAPAISSLIPNSATAGDGDLVLSVSGSNFNPSSVVRWNGAGRVTNFVNSSMLSTTIPSTDLTAPGSAVVTVFNPDTGGGLSDGQTFTITPVGGGGSPAAVPFLTGIASGQGTLRNDFSGWVGMRLTIGAAPVTVTSIGRFCVSGNGGIHQVKFVSAASGGDVTGGSVSVNMAGCAAGQFVYSAISPVSLPAGTSYYLVSQETQNGDRWYDHSGVSSTTVAAVNSSVYFYGGNWIPINSANTSYVPPNFQYSLATPSPITVSVGTSLAGASFSVDGTAYTTAHVFTWTAGSSHTIAATSPQTAGTGTQNVWSSWSDNGPISHTVAPTGSLTYTASFTTQYLLTNTVSPAGSGGIAASPSAAGGFYASGLPVQLTATPAVGCTFVNWTGDLAGTANPQTVTMAGPQTVTANFQCSSGEPPTPTAFLTGYGLGGKTSRNDFTGWVGMKFTVGSSALTATSLGRACVANNTLAHVVKFVNAGNGSDVAGAAVSVNMAGCTAGGFVYSPISPVALPAGASYYLVSQETQNGDRWYDQGGVSPTAAGAVNSAVYSYNGGWYPIGVANTSYVPPNFQYSTGGAPAQYLLTRSVSPAGSGSIVASPSAAGGSYASGMPVQLTATPAAGCTFVNWTGDLTGTANPQTVTMPGPQTVTANFQCSSVPPAPTAFLTGYGLSGKTLRNDFTGWVGMKLTVGASALTVTSLGRACVTNNTLAHMVKFVNASNGSDVAGAAVSVNMAGCTAGGFVYSTISPVALPAGASYYLVSQETQNGDRWYDQGGVSPTAAGAVNSAVYSYNGGWYPIGVANTSYVPPNFQYSIP